MIINLDKSIANINPTTFDIWDELYWAIDRDKDMLDGGSEGWLWLRWALHALAGMAKANLESILNIDRNLTFR